jgi:type IV pilus assembly protein PilE
MKKYNGFSLLELMIVVTIVGILLVLAVVIYSSQVKQGRRADGIDSLNAMSLAEEQYRSNNLQYGTLAQVWSGVTSSTGGYYTLSISNVSATGYTLTAAAQGNQASDAEGATSCASLQLAVSNGTVTRTPSICWPQ